MRKVTKKCLLFERCSLFEKCSARVGAPFMAFIYQFFVLFVFMSELPLAMCWCTSWVSGTVCGMWTVTFCDPFSCRAYGARREGRLRLRARLHEDQGDLW